MKHLDDISNHLKFFSINCVLSLVFVRLCNFVSVLFNILCIF